MLIPKGIKAKTSPINSTTKKKKLELDALRGRAAGLHVCIKLIWSGKASKSVPSATLDKHPHRLSHQLIFHSQAHYQLPHNHRSVDVHGLKRAKTRTSSVLISPILSKNLIQGSHPLAQNQWCTTHGTAVSRHILTAHLLSELKYL